VNEIKLDGYRELAIKSEGKVRLRSRNDNDFTVRYPQIASATPGATVGISQVTLRRAYF
jgi:ATP-dependent DNA ligase